MIHSLGASLNILSKSTSMLQKNGNPNRTIASFVYIILNHWIVCGISNGETHLPLTSSLNVSESQSSTRRQSIFSGNEFHFHGDNHKIYRVFIENRYRHLIESNVLKPGLLRWKVSLYVALAPALSFVAVFTDSPQFLPP